MKTKHQEPDIWLQENETSGKSDDCSCRLDAEYSGEPDGGDNPSPAFFMCPLHAAAPDLLASVRELRECLANWMEIADKDDEREYDKLAIKNAARAIKKAEGRP